MSVSHITEFSAYFQAYDFLPEAVYLIDLVDASILYANRSGCEHLAMTPEELGQHTVFDLQRDVQDLTHWQKIIEVIQLESPYVFMGRHVRKDNSEFPVEVLSRLITLNGQDYLLSTVRDLTRRQAIETDLRQREPLLAYALNEASDGMWDWNVATGEVFFSPQLKRILGYGPYEMKPVVDTWKNNIHPQDRERVMAAMENHLNGKNIRFEAEYRLANRSGQYLWVNDRGMVCARDANGDPVRIVGMVHDIDKQKAQEQRLRNLATTDELTGLLNRRAGYAAFEHSLKLAIRHEHDLCVALMDLDNFKGVNDMYGHLVGDKLLRGASTIFRSRVRASDVLMRWGGEEFLLVMPHTTSADARGVCEDLRVQLEQELFRTAIGDITVTASIGIAHLSDTNESIKQLVQEADSALYRAKALGKNRTIVN